jgi:hypothetical protein
VRTQVSPARPARDHSRVSVPQSPPFSNRVGPADTGYTVSTSPGRSAGESPERIGRRVTGRRRKPRLDRRCVFETADRSTRTLGASCGTCIRTTTSADRRGMTYIIYLFGGRLDGAGRDRQPTHREVFHQIGDERVGRTDVTGGLRPFRSQLHGDMDHKAGDVYVHNGDRRARSYANVVPDGVGRICRGGGKMNDSSTARRGTRPRSVPPGTNTATLGSVVSTPRREPTQSHGGRPPNTGVINGGQP